ALGQVGAEAQLAGQQREEVVRALALASLGDEDEAVRWYAARALFRLGPGLEPATRLLAASLKDERKQMVSRAAELLATEGAGAVPILTAALEDPRCADRSALIFALGRLGRQAGPAVPLLLRLLGGKERRLRQAAARALLVIEPKAVAKAL